MSLPRCLLHATSEGGSGDALTAPESEVVKGSEPLGGEVSDHETTRHQAAAREAELTRLIADRERLISERERTFRGVLLERELAVALAGRVLVPGAAAQLMKLWRDEFDVVEEDGEYRVVSRDGKAVGRAVDEWLGLSEYAHFRPARSRGGSGAAGSQNDAPPEPGRPAETLGESIVRRWREGPGSRPEGSSVIGLSGRRMR
jgi:hypothetical protein